MAAALQVLPCLLRAPSRPLLWGPPVARMTSGMALAEQARQLFDSAVGAVQPGPMLQRTLSLDPSGKTAEGAGPDLPAAGKPLPSGLRQGRTGHGSCCRGAAGSASCAGCDQRTQGDPSRYGTCWKEVRVYGRRGTPSTVLWKNTSLLPL